MEAMKKKIGSLLKDIGKFELFGSSDTSTRGITADSRQVGKDYIFVAVRGINFDGHNFIKQAVKSGASVVVCEKVPENTNDATYIVVADTRKVLGVLAAAWFGYPSRKLKIIGVTGTDGKTTTCHLIYHILATAGMKVGLVSTILAKVGKKEFDTGLHVTNPDPVSLQAFLAKMVESGCEYAVIEVTSHGIDQQRIAGVDFDTAALTNITHDHLDYHKNFDNYRKVKISFLKLAKNTVVLNKDDKSWKVIQKLLPRKTKVFFYSLKGNVDARAREIEDTQKGLEFNIYYEGHPAKIVSNLHGKYNVSNMMAAISVAEIYDIPVQRVVKAIRSFDSPAGRLQEVSLGQSFKVFIDFAHTPNALLNVLTYLRKVTQGRLISVFGCAGERDKSKRREMGKISGKISDISVITAEDPRSEKVTAIINRIASGARSQGAVEISKNLKIDNEKSKYFLKIPERGEAVYYAIRKLAKPGDTVVICGKGHERSMAYGLKEYPWSDEEAAREAFKGRVLRIER